MKVARTYRIDPSTDKQIRALAKKLDVSQAEVIRRSLAGELESESGDGLVVKKPSAILVSEECVAHLKAVERQRIRMAREPLTKSNGKIL